jgi:uncharacterized membrane protein YphA (DoxX/SURF4 family)
MKKLNIAYWIVTGIFSAFMFLSSISNVMSSPDAVAIFKQLGYPVYLLPFLGIAKMLGAVALLIPGFPRVKEWAYAGLAFDLLGAVYSFFCIGMSIAESSFMILPISFLIASYVLYHKRLKAQSTQQLRYAV